MPLFTYKCEECANEQEFLLKMAAPNPMCPRCGSNMVKKIGGKPPLAIYKGDGFYNTRVTKTLPDGTRIKRRYK